MNKSEWLEKRKRGIGGSDAAAILGVSKYKTPYGVWADKLGLIKPKETTEAMKQGTELEAYVAQRFTEATGLRVRRNNKILINPNYPFALANVDRCIVGQNAGLECKTCSPYRYSEFTETEFPIEYFAQCLHYLAVTGYQRWYLAALIFGTDFKIYEINRDAVAGQIEQLMEQERIFWGFVESKTPPAVDGLLATTQAISEVYSDSIDKTIQLDEMFEDFCEIERISDEISELEQEKERYKQQIKLSMGEYTKAECGIFTASWKPNKRGQRVFTIRTEKARAQRT